MARFQDYSGGRKHVHVDLTTSDLRADPEMAEELHQLIETAYAPIGGHLNYKTGADLAAEDALVVTAVDVDQDPYADVALVSKRKPYGLKGAAIGHDGTRTAKSEAIKSKAQKMRRRGNYAEVSGAMAHILITRFHVPAVTNEQVVRRVLGKDIEWVGPHPEGKYPDHPGWYYRKIGGKRTLKVMLGYPLVENPAPMQRSRMSREEAICVAKRVAWAFQSAAAERSSGGRRGAGRSRSRVMMHAMADAEVSIRRIIGREAYLRYYDAIKDAVYECFFGPGGRGRFRRRPSREPRRLPGADDLIPADGLWT